MSVNGYKIRYNEFFKTWQVSHDDIGARIAEFDLIYDAIEYCKNG